MSGMRTVVVDKIASVTSLRPVARDSNRRGHSCEEVWWWWWRFSTTSRLQHFGIDQRPYAKVARGDVVVGALGHRKPCSAIPAIFRALKPGDVIQMLNIGGVLGICDSATPDKASLSTARSWAPC